MTGEKGRTRSTHRRRIVPGGGELGYRRKTGPRDGWMGTVPGRERTARLSTRWDGTDVRRAAKIRSAERVRKLFRCFVVPTSTFARPRTLRACRWANTARGAFRACRRYFSAYPRTVYYTNFLRLKYPRPRWFFSFNRSVDRSSTKRRDKYYWAFVRQQLRNTHRLFDTKRGGGQYNRSITTNRTIVLSS